MPPPLTSPACLAFAAAAPPDRTGRAPGTPSSCSTRPSPSSPGWTAGIARASRTPSGDAAIEEDRGASAFRRGRSSWPARSSWRSLCEVPRVARGRRGPARGGARRTDANCARCGWRAAAYPGGLLRRWPRCPRNGARRAPSMRSSCRPRCAAAGQASRSSRWGTPPARTRRGSTHTAATRPPTPTSCRRMSPEPARSGSQRTELQHPRRPFSTFVLFETGVAAISGNACPKGELEAFNFPNPFDLSDKTVTPIHGAPAQRVRGTMIRVAVPPGSGGEGSCGSSTRPAEGARAGARRAARRAVFTTRSWNGRNDSEGYVASGVYVGQAKLGRQIGVLQDGGDQISGGALLVAAALLAGCRVPAAAFGRGSGSPREPSSSSSPQRATRPWARRSARSRTTRRPRTKPGRSRRIRGPSWPACTAPCSRASGRTSRQIAVPLLVPEPRGRARNARQSCFDPRA